MITKKTLLLFATSMHILVGGLSFVEAKHDSAQETHLLDTYTQPKEGHQSAIGKSLDKVIVEPMFKASLKAAGAFLKHTPLYFFFQGMVGAPFYPYKAIQEYALYKEDSHKNIKIAMVMVPEAAGALLQMIIDQKIVHLVRKLVLNNPGSGIVGFLIDAGIGLGIHAVALYTYLKIQAVTAKKARASELK